MYTGLSIKLLIDSLFHSVSNEPKYIHSYVPLFGFGLQMFKILLNLFVLYMYDMEKHLQFIYNRNVGLFSMMNKPI